MNNSTEVRRIRRDDYMMRRHRDQVVAEAAGTFIFTGEPLVRHSAEFSGGIEIVRQVRGVEQNEGDMKQTARTRDSTGTAVLLVASRTAADSQDLDLREGALITCQVGPVSHEHKPDRDKRDKGITEQDQRKLNHVGTPLLCGVP